MLFVPATLFLWTFIVIFDVLTSSRDPLTCLFLLLSAVAFLAGGAITSYFIYKRGWLGRLLKLAPTFWSDPELKFVPEVGATLLVGRVGFKRYYAAQLLFERPFAVPVPLLLGLKKLVVAYSGGLVRALAVANSPSVALSFAWAGGGRRARRAECGALGSGLLGRS